MHGIMENDKGVVSGVKDVWHKMPQYVCIPDRSLTVIEAMKVANYPMEKQQLSLPSGELVDAWAVVRTDTNSVLVPSVGERFDIIPNSDMVNTIDQNLLSVYPELTIQSVGTLWNGATFFINLCLDEFQVKGDKSPTLTNLMYTNPLGRGSYASCVHNVRVVCQNTEKLAQAQGLANQSLKKFSHTKTAKDRITDHLIDMAEMKLHLEAHKEMLDTISDVQMSSTEVKAFLDIMFPEPEKEGRKKTIAMNAKEGIMNIFEGSQRENLVNPTSKYALYNAFTDWNDHVRRSRNADSASIAYDGIMGNRADQKQEFLNKLVPFKMVA